MCKHNGSGIMAVLPRLHDDTPSPSEQPLVLVTDAGNDTVHIIDVVGRTHAGYLAAPGTIVGPRGIAIHQRAWSSRSGSRSKSKSESGQRSTLVAVTAWKNQYAGHHVVVLYENNGPVWEKVRVIGGNFGFPGSVKGQMHQPYGVRISKDGTQVCVCDKQNNRIIFFSAEEGSVLRQVIVTDPSSAPDVGNGEPSDLEEVEGGWLFASFLRGRGIWYMPNGDGNKTSPVDFHRVGDVQHPVSITPCLAWGWSCERFCYWGQETRACKCSRPRRVPYAQEHVMHPCRMDQGCCARWSCPWRGRGLPRVVYCFVVFCLFPYCPLFCLYGCRYVCFSFVQTQTRAFLKVELKRHQKIPSVRAHTHSSDRHVTSCCQRGPF